MVDGEIDVADLPEAWRAESQDLLGIAPERDADGVLQDIHWSMFLIGYFPTYSLGNLYSAQFHAAMARDIGDWRNRFDAASSSTSLAGCAIGFIVTDASIRPPISANG